MSARILHIAYGGPGGVGEVVTQLAARTDQRRFRTSVCFFGIEPPPPVFPARLDAAGIEWNFIHLNGRLRSLSKLLRHCVQQRPDVVLAHGPTHARVLPMLRVLLPKTRCVAVYHGPPSLGSTISGALRWLPGLAAAHRVVCVAPHLAELLRRNLRCSAQVIPNGVDVAARYEARERTGPARLLMPALMFPSKDHATLLEAAAILVARGFEFQLTLAGDGVLRGRLEQRAKELGMDGHVEFPGWLGAGELRRRLRECDAFVYATHGEGCTMAILEAMAAARPVVASRVPGVTDLLDDGRTALLVPPRDAAALADAIAAVLSSSELARRLGNAALDAVRKQHQLGRTVEAYGQLFDSLLSSSWNPATESASCTSRL